MALADTCTEIFKDLDRELWLVTAQAGDRRSGLIAVHASRVSLAPSLTRMTIALSQCHFTRELIEESNAFCMHLIEEWHLDWVWRFGLPSGRNVDKFSGLGTSKATNGAPILSDAISWLECRVEARLDIGDRTIYVAEVVDAKTNRPAKPLTFRRLLQIAPTDKLRELKANTERQIELDRTAILDWRQRATQR